MLTYPRYLLPISPPAEDESRVGRDGSQVDGACRDLLETVTRGPRGDIVSICTRFPWPSLRHPPRTNPQPRSALCSRLTLDFGTHLQLGLEIVGKNL
jgi:hypothetical protein